MKAFPVMSDEEHALQSIAGAVGLILSQFEGDVEREGLKDTPLRVAKALCNELLSGYKVDIPSLFKTFPGDGHNSLVLLKDIEFNSMCEHHMLPFIGKAHIAYIPKDRVLGVSKLARVLDAFAKRLQIQERICDQVVDALEKNLSPTASACIIEAKHQCMSCRGVGKQHSVMVTSALRGTFLTDERARAELYSLIR